VIVVDASAMIEWLLETPVGLKIQQRALSDGYLCAPHLLDLEVAQALRKLVRTQKIDNSRGQQALDDFRDMDLSRYPHEDFLQRIWGLRHTCTAYDAMYIALAESLAATLITHDQKLASAPGHNAKLECI
jgi:predicted nucleic acid-binding protein